MQSDPKPRKDIGQNLHKIQGFSGYHTWNVYGLPKITSAFFLSGSQPNRIELPQTMDSDISNALSDTDKATLSNPSNTLCYYLHCDLRV